MEIQSDHQAVRFCRLRSWCRCVSVWHGCHQCVWDQCRAVWNYEGKRFEPGGGAGWWGHRTHGWKGTTSQVHNNHLRPHACNIAWCGLNALTRPSCLCKSLERHQQAITWQTCLWGQRAPWGSSPRLRCACMASPRPWCRPSALFPQSRLLWTARCRFFKREYPSLASVRG